MKHRRLPGVPRAAAVVVGLALDRLIGEPPDRIHPVAALGRAFAAIERRSYGDSRGRGVAHLAAGLAIAAGVGAAAASAGPIGLASVTAAAVAGRMLAGSAEAVGDALAFGDLDAARALLPTLVGRDPSDLDAAEVARAVVESVAENTVDAVTAPLFWGCVAGPVGVVAHRVVNTLDAMVGHHSPRYENFGWASARGDDLAAWLPARLTAVSVAAVRPRAALRIWRAVRDQAPSHPSPNGGVVEAAFAAALGVRLGGRNRYGDRLEDRPQLGWGSPPQPTDIAAAVRLLRDLSWFWAAALTVLALVRGLGRSRGAAACRRRRTRCVSSEGPG